MRWLAAVVVVVILPTACSVVRDPADGPTRREEWQSQLPELLAASSSYEQEALADGVVTAEEHEAGFAAMVRCIKEHGAEVVEVSRGEHGKIRQWTTRGDAMVSDRCQREFFTHIQLGYSITLNPDLTPGKLVRLMVECMRDAGVTGLPDNAYELELVDLLRSISNAETEDLSAVIAYGDCYEHNG